MELLLVEVALRYLTLLEPTSLGLLLLAFPMLKSPLLEEGVAVARLEDQVHAVLVGQQLRQQAAEGITLLQAKLELEELLLPFQRLALVPELEALPEAEPLLGATAQEPVEDMEVEEALLMMA
jgi:hypothetical protein